MAEQSERPRPAQGTHGAGGGRPDVATLCGLGLALGGILGGLILEGGTIAEILQPTAAMIVFGGTLGAVMVATPLHVVLAAFRELFSVFFEKQQSPDVVIEEIIGYATKARKNGIVSLEEEAEAVQDRFLRKALTLAVDGTDLQEIRKMMELEIALEEQNAEARARVFEQAGGYAPTIGIIGAVMGLIQVMKHLANIDEVGKGIAVAFVATIYGVGSANIFFIPSANKIRARMHATSRIRELMLEGVAGIVEGLNPKLIRSKLEAYVQSAQPAGAAKKAPAGEKRAAAKPAAAR